MTLAITGSTGQLGRLVIHALKARAGGEPVVALARDPAKAADLGIEARPFDYDDPATLAPALGDVDTLLLISGSDVGQRVRQHGAVIEAAKQAGVDHIVYTSLLRADTSPLALAPEHVETEALLAGSGIAHTILRNGWYTENYTMGIGAALANNALIGAAGDGQISSATRGDFAEAAAAVLSDTSLRGQTYELAGDTAYTLGDLAAVLSEQTGKAIPYVNMAEADYAAALTGAGMPAPLAGFLAQCDTEVSKGAVFSQDRALSHLIGRPTTTLEAAVKSALAEAQ